MDKYTIHTDSKTNGRLLIWNKHHLKTSKLLALDLDYTFIKPKSGALFSKNADDWMLMYPDDSSISEIDKYMHNGYSIVFMTNQKGLATEIKLEEFKQKWSNIITYLNTTYPQLDTTQWTLLASLNTSIYRKPAPGMWNFTINELELELELNQGHAFNKSESLYVGDAAGRPKDFSAADIMFSLNVGVKFMVPEIFFGVSQSKELQAMKLKQNILKNKKYFQPDKFLTEYHSHPKELPDLTAIQNSHLVIMVGAQASGKSTFCRKYLKKHIHMSNDTFKGTPAAFKKELEALLKAGKHIVIDNTNPTVEGRAKWIALARKYEVSCVGVYMQSTDNKLYIEHMLKLRDILGIQHVPIIALKTFYKKLEKPTMEEGFDTLVKIPLELDVAEEAKKHDIPLDAFSWWLD
jgi:bifunctional polynucleotide phosphatase/kinase